MARRYWIKKSIYSGGIILATLALLYPITIFNFHLRPGDLLFQDLNCGPLCRAITSVTAGINGSNISHVAMVINTHASEPIVIEAMPPKVATISLSQFLLRSRDQNGKPRVLVGRLRQPYRQYIPAAIQFTQQQLGKPYNASFIPNQGQSYYCSQLIAAAWQQANHNKALFVAQPMNFADPKTHKILNAWQQYFTQLRIPAPQGMLGTNPGAISRSGTVTITHAYGKLTNSIHT